MSANVSKSKLPLKEVLKPTGFRAPKAIENLPFTEALKADNPSIESSKSVTIDVSKYSKPVEITPSDGKDGIAKVTVTLTGIV